MCWLNKGIDSSKKTYDSIFDGNLGCFQHKNGYRFSVDAVLLAHFAKITQNDRIIDLATGCGIISMILLYRHHDKIDEICGIEIQRGLARLTKKNLSTNRFKLRSKVIEGDIKNIKKLIESESYDIVICNPPYYRPKSGRPKKNIEANLAQHQYLASLKDFLIASAVSVKNEGDIFFIYPADQLGEFIVSGKELGFEAKRIQFIYSHPHENNSAWRVLIHCIKNGGPGVKILPPFYVYCKKNGVFSAKMQNLYQKNSNYSSV